MTHPEGICGDESPTHPLNCTGTMRQICHLRHGHGSKWHESETGARWKYHDADPIAAAESRGYAKAIAKLRDEDAFWSFMESHPLGEDMVEVANNPGRVCADFLEASSPSTEEPNHG